MFFKERKYERYGYNAPILFMQKNNEIWSWGISNDISQGGLFLKTEQTQFNEGDVLTLKITNLVKGILVSIDARIVRVASEKGLGVEFIGASGAPELQSLLSYLKATWTPLKKAPPPSPWEKEKALNLAKELLDRAQFMDYYRILDLTPDSSDKEIVEKTSMFLETLTISERGLSDHDKKLLKDAIMLVKRLGGILANPSRRFSYNIAVGIDPIGTAKQIMLHRLPLSKFKKYYDHRYREKANKSNELAKKLIEAKNKGDLTLVKSLKEQGLKLNPFNPLFWEE